jgi:hypothetical protein
MNGLLGSHFNLGHLPQGTPGIDLHDGIYVGFFNFDGYTTKSISVVEGKELDAQSESSYGEPVGTSVGHYIVIETGKSLVLNAPVPYEFTASSFGYLPDYSPLCDGVEASNYSETGTIPAGTYTGEVYLGSTSITFYKNVQQPEIVAPTIDTLSPSASGDGATFYVNVSEDGNSVGTENCTYRFGYYNVSGGGVIYTPWKCCLTDGQTGSDSVSGLIPGSYLVYSEASNRKGSTVGDLEAFIIAQQIYSPTVETLSASDIGTRSATAWGKIKETGGESPNGFILYWVYGNEGNVYTTESVSGLQKDDEFGITLSLDPDTWYGYRAGATNSAGSSTGGTQYIHTLEEIIIEPNEPADPNTVPIAFNPHEPNTLLVQNFIKSLQTDPNKPHKNQGTLRYVEGIGLNVLDVNDILYSPANAEKAAKLVSLIAQKNANNQTNGFYELSKDARPKILDPNDPNSLVLLEASIYAANGELTSSENGLKFWLAPNAFSGNPLTIQQVSPDANIVYPVWDVKSIIDKNGRLLPLNNLANQKPNAGYAWFNLSHQDLMDFNGDRKVDLADYSLILGNIGKTGASRFDIARPGAGIGVYILGLPDGKVTKTEDEAAFITRYNKENPSNPIIIETPKNIEGFEKGVFGIKCNPAAYNTTSAWTVASDGPHSGNYYAKAVNNHSGGNSYLEASVVIPQDGNISFWYKLNSDYSSGLSFKIDDRINGTVASYGGNHGWTKVSYPVKAGNHKLIWFYKQNSTTLPEEYGAIDDVEYSDPNSDIW